MIQTNKLNKVLIVAAIILVVPGYLRAQQQPSNYNYIVNPFSINPAFAGYYVNPELNFYAKGSFQGVDGAPEFLSFSAHGKALDPKVGLGANVFSDKIGVSRTTGVFGSYAYKLVSRNKNSYTSFGYKPNVLAVGIRAGAVYYKEDLQSLNMENDPNFEENLRTVIPMFSFGAYYSKNDFFIGFSVPELISVPFSKQVDVSRHFYLNSGYDIKTGAFTKLKLIGLLKYVYAAPLQVNANAILNYKDRFSFGLGYRTVSTVNFMLGFNFLKGFQAAYFYDMILESKPRDRYFNTHEISLSYRFFK